MRTRIVAAGLVLSLAGLTACGDLNNSDDAGSTENGESWQPSQPVQVIVPYGAGGGTDIVFRQLTEIINQDGLSDVQWVVENREGGSGTTGMQFVAGQEGDDHLLMGTTPGHISVPLNQSMDVNIGDLTPVANTLIDPQVLWAHQDSQLTDVQSIVDALQAEPQSVSLGGLPVAQDDHLTTLMFERAADVKLNYVPFSGGGEVKTAILGGQVDVAWLNPSEAVGQTVDDGGPLVPIAVALEERLDGLPDIPTFVEGGYDVVYDMFFRALTAPPGVSDAAVDYYADVVEQATETQEWQDFIADSQVQANYLGSDELTASFDEWSTEVESLLGDQS